MSSELLNGDKIMPDGSKRTYVNGLVTFIAYPAGTTRAQMILPKEINRLEGVQVNSIVLPPPTYTSSYNIDEFQRAIDDGIRMASYQKEIDDGIKTRNDLDSYQKEIDGGIKTPSNYNSYQKEIDDGIKTPSNYNSYQKEIDGGIKTPSNYNSYQKEIDGGIKTATFNNLQDQIRGEPSFISDNYILIIILSISILILLILFFIYKNKKSMNVENIIASFGLI
jgi:hypothetical protein